MLIESLKIFCDLVDTQSFSRAAMLNSVTQSAVSQQIKTLERREGKKLLEREKRRLNLTAGGEVFYRYAREIIRRYEEMQHRLNALGDVVSGAVRVSAIYSVGMLELGPYIKTYLKAYPKVYLHLDYNRAWEIYDEVANGNISVGIVDYPRPQRNIEVIPFTQDRLVVICPADHPLGEKGHISIQDLNGCPFIACPEDIPTWHTLNQILRKHRVQPRVVMELDHVSTVKNAVEVGLGVSFVPAPSIVQEEKQGVLKVLRLEEEDLIRPLGILHRRGRSLSIATQKLIDVLTEGRVKAVQTGEMSEESGR